MAKKTKNLNLDEELEEEKGGKGAVILVVFILIVLWLAILALCIKMDVGGFGSKVMYPVLKNVPVVNKILPKMESDVVYNEDYPYATLSDALAQIRALELEIQGMQEKQEADQTTIEDLTAENKRLKQFENNQAEFEKQKNEYYDEVVFGKNAISAEEYKKYYESIEPENAELLYKQAVKTLETDEKVTEYAAAYAAMKPDEAAGIFEAMTDDLELAGDILWSMDSDSRGKILGAMKKDIAAKITKIMEP